MTLHPSLRPITGVMILGLVAQPVLATTSENGGSGLVRVDHAWSMPLSGFVVTTYGTYYSNDFTPGTDRLFRLTPTLTKGLGGGFEASAALPFEGLAQNLDDETFDRRFDLRRRDLQMKARWTGPFGGERARLGIQGSFGLPLARLQDRRPGGDRDPDAAFDPGVSALASFNVGAFEFPVRVHANLGYWWSRDDGAVYYRDHSFALPLDFDGITHNDVVTAGLAVEAGFRRFVAFTEVTTEQLVGARAQLEGRENLWRVTPGIRTEVGSNVGLTAALSFDASRNDPATAFDPQEVYPDLELRVGITLGQVLARTRHEDARRQQRTARDLSWTMTPAPVAGGEPATTDASAAPTDTKVAGTPARPVDASPSVAAAPASSTATTSSPPPAAPPASSTADAVRDPAASSPVVGIVNGQAMTSHGLERLEARLDRLETTLRIQALEARLATIEGTPGPRTELSPPTSGPIAGAAPSAATPSASAPTAVASTPPATTSPAPTVDAGVPEEAPPAASAPSAEDAALRATVARLEAEMTALRAAPTTASPGTSTRSTTSAPAPTPSAPAASVPVASGPASPPVASAPTTSAPAPAAPPPVTSSSPAAPAVVLQIPGSATSDVRARSNPPDDAIALHALLDDLEALTRSGPGSPESSGASLPIDEGDTDTAPVVPDASRAPDPAPAVEDTTSRLPLAIGEQATYATGTVPTGDADLLAAIDPWGPLLEVDPGANLLVIVEGGPDDRTLALAESQRMAETLLQRLVDGGASAGQLTALGLGRPGGDATGWRVTLERTP